MAWEDFLNHKCDIYHISKDDNDIGYGVTDSESFSYPEEPDLKDVNCHFMIKTGSYVVVQNEPVNNYDARVKIAFPAGTDVRLNDKIISHETGFSYIAEIPRIIKHAHHITVYANRDGDVKEAV